MLLVLVVGFGVLVWVDDVDVEPVEPVEVLELVEVEVEVELVWEVEVDPVEVDPVEVDPVEVDPVEVDPVEVEVLVDPLLVLVLTLDVPVAEGPPVTTVVTVVVWVVTDPATHFPLS